MWEVYIFNTKNFFTNIKTSITDLPCKIKRSRDEKNYPYSILGIPIRKNGFKSSATSGSKIFRPCVGLEHSLISVKMGGPINFDIKNI